MAIYNDYLHRKAVFNALNDIGGCGALPESWADGWDKAIDAAIEAIEKLPNADVEPVKRGHWYNRGGRFRCSVCDTKAYLKDVGGTGGMVARIHTAKAAVLPELRC